MDQPTRFAAETEDCLVQVSMAAAPSMPLTDSWLEECPAYHSDDAITVRTAVRMLQKAWRSVPAGTLPSNPGTVAGMLGLTREQWSERFDVLMAGWTLREGRLVHEPMYELALNIWRSQSDALDQLAARMVLVPQDPDAFQLVAQEPVAASPLKGKKRVPADFGLTPDLRKWLETTLFVSDPADQEFLLGKFKDYAVQGAKYSDPDAGFRLFCSREDLRKLPSKVRRYDSSGLAQRFGAAGLTATAKNRDVMREVTSRRNAASGTAHADDAVRPRA